MGYGDRSQWQHGLRRRSAAGRLLRLWVRIPPQAWISVCCECCVLPCRGVCKGLITRPEESYWLWCVVVFDLETSWMRRPWPTGGCCAKIKSGVGGVKLTNHTRLLPRLWMSGAKISLPLYVISKCIVQHFYLITTVKEMLQTKRTFCRFIPIIAFMSLCIETRV